MSRSGALPWRPPLADVHSVAGTWDTRSRATQVEDVEPKDQLGRSPNETRDTAASVRRGERVRTEGRGLRRGRVGSKIRPEESPRAPSRGLRQRTNLTVVYPYPLNLHEGVPCSGERSPSSNTSTLCFPPPSPRFTLVGRSDLGAAEPRGEDARRGEDA